MRGGQYFHLRGVLGASDELPEDTEEIADRPREKSWEKPFLHIQGVALRGLVLSSDNHALQRTLGDIPGTTIPVPKRTNIRECYRARLSRELGGFQVPMQKPPPKSCS